MSGVQPVQLKTHDGSILRNAVVEPLNESMLLDFFKVLYMFHVFCEKNAMSYHQIYS